MNGLIAWFARNSIAANMLMVIIAVAGIVVIQKTQKEIFPQVSLNTITITALYPGASPEEVEEAVCMRIERAINGLNGINEISAAANESVCIVSVSIELDAEKGILLDGIKSAVGGISNFPSTVTRPIVKEISINHEIARLMVSGQANYRALRGIAENVRNDLYDRGIGHIEVASAKDYEISIEISEAALQRYNMTFAEVAQAIQRNSMKASGGAVATSGGMVSVEAIGQATSSTEYGEIVLRAQPDGGQVILSDIARIIDGFQESHAETFFDGKPAIPLRVYPEDQEDILHISKILNEYVADPKRHFPEGIALDLDIDNAKYFKSRIELLVDNAISGLALVFITLLLFLHLRLGFWVSMGIPLSFLGAFIVLYLSGGTINMISTFALLIVLGIVVDDAIIVGENIYIHQNRGLKGVDGAIKGAQEIAKPVIFAVVTTAITFAPLFFLPGPDGKMLASIPTIAVATLTFSLMESLLILPAHLSHHQAKPATTRVDPLTKIQQKFSAFLDRCIIVAYRPLLDKALNWRYATVVAFFMLFFISVALVAGGWIHVTMLSDLQAEIALAQVEYPKGTAAETTQATLKRIEKIGLELKDELNSTHENQQVLHTRLNMNASGDGGMVVLVLSGADQRSLSGEEINNIWRKRVGEIKGTSKLAFTSTFNDPGAPISIKLSAHDPKLLKQAAEALREHISEYPATYNVRDSFQGGKREVQLRLKSHARDLGMDLQMLVLQVHQAFQGIEVQSLLRNQQEVKVYLRYPKEERSSLWQLENMQIRLADGTHVPLSSIADVFYDKGPSHIVRLNGKRIIQVTAHVDEAISNPTVINSSIYLNFLSKIEENYPGVTWGESGAQQVRSALANDLVIGFFAAMLVMFMLMAILFGSYFQPLIVMSAIPFGLIGAMFGHMVTGVELTLWSAAGMIAVSGVVVNDNMVLIFYINERRAEGMPLIKAIKQAGAERFRPIMLTSITTFVGLAPLIMERSYDAQFLKPMAISIAFGVLIATFVSLILIPVFYLIMEDVGGFFSKVKSKTVLQPVMDEDNLLFDDETGL